MLPLVTWVTYHHIVNPPYLPHTEGRGGRQGPHVGSPCNIVRSIDAYYGAEVERVLFRTPKKQQGTSQPNCDEVANKLI